MMMQKRNFLSLLNVGLGAVVLSSLIGLSGCVTTQPASGPIAQVGFAHLPPLHLAVADVVVRSTYQSPLKSPNVEHAFKTSPQVAMTDWANTRLKIKGGDTSNAHVEFIIEDAAVIEEALEKSKGFLAFLTYQPTTKYTARAVASMQLRTDGNAGGSASLRVTTTRSIEISENANLAQREQKWMELVENLMRDFNGQMETQIQKHFARWR